MEPKTTTRAARARANGAKSKGPTTAAGKHASSQNAVRHGLLAKTIVLENEAAARFDELLADLMAEHAPTNPTEVILVENMASARWRLTRILCMQKATLEATIAAQNPALELPAMRGAMSFRFSQSTSGRLLLRYEATLDRQFHRSLYRLRRLQAERGSEDAPVPTPNREDVIAEVVVLDIEEKSEFLELHADLTAQHAPVTKTEKLLVQTMATSRWRLLRTWSNQKHSLDFDNAQQSVDDFTGRNDHRKAAIVAHSFEIAEPTYELLLQYEIVLERQFHRALVRLGQLRNATTKRTHDSTEVVAPAR